ncbi:MAG: L-threonine 3-dehydrogenase [Planctomycetes bacterium]|nr:L-threonine 3-dehydrogenase [Planctomycetota bacterium]MBU4399928.1 L-threonine 3-dehydrogenase [Planctomycetota bacterium]MCG2685282.1 L-threonine 3-dehydrogenase [Planctomycetales bacterium]
MERVLVTGAVGQIGSELTLALRKKYGSDNVVAGGRKTKPSPELRDSGPFEVLDCTDVKAVEGAVKKYGIDTIYHLAALLSAVAEANPQLAWKVNIDGLYNVLEVAREHKCAVFVPSSIGAFGLSTPQDGTPQDTIQRPNTMYGVTKVAGELLCDYYHKRFGVDTRGVRYPGIISNVTLPGGGTTDYAVEIFYKAIKEGKYTCFLKKGTKLDMMYMPDAIKAALDLMDADPKKLKHRNAFNVTAMSFAPEEIAAEVKKLVPNFTMDYSVDPVRQAIAESWPNYMDDGAAREEWGWQPAYDLPAMAKDMIEVLSKKLSG